MYDKYLCDMRPIVINLDYLIVSLSCTLTEYFISTSMCVL